MHEVYLKTDFLYAYHKHKKYALFQPVTIFTSNTCYVANVMHEKIDLNLTAVVLLLSILFYGKYY